MAQDYQIRRTLDMIGMLWDITQTYLFPMFAPLLIYAVGIWGIIYVYQRIQERRKRL